MELLIQYNTVCAWKAQVYHAFHEYGSGLVMQTHAERQSPPRMSQVIRTRDNNEATNERIQ